MKEHMAVQNPDDQQVASKKARTLWLGPVWAAAIMFMAMCGVPLAINTILPQSVPRGDYEAVANGFFHALLRNDLQMAQHLVIVEQQARLEKWMATRQGFVCPFKLTLDHIQDGEPTFGVTGRVSDSPQATSSWSYACVDEEYRFEVDDIELELGTDRSWLVVSWTACEKYRGNVETCDK